MKYTQVTSLSRKEQRHKLAEDVLWAVRVAVPGALVDARVDWHRGGPRDPEVTITASVPGLAVTSWLQPRWAAAPLLHWYDAERRLRGVQGAWHSWDVNSYHGCKATSFCEGLDDMVGRIIKGLLAAIDGSAFRPT